MSPQWITHQSPAIVLAPMEGVTDAPMRALLCERGGFNYCVSEFLRISQDVPPARTYLEHVPELAHGCATPNGTPIQIQLLGGHPERLAISAARACTLGARAIDLNFGCPAPTVNRNDGGATLLKYPERIRDIIRAVREAVPAEFPVSAKLRLGFDTMEAIFLNARMAEEGGASWITIHARTKQQGYIPPAHWNYIAEARKQVSIPVVANGEIWSLDDFRRCREVTGCEHFMIGRGALGDPALPLAMARELGLAAPHLDRETFSADPSEWRGVLLRFAELSGPYSSGTGYTTRRIKQWVRFATVRRAIPWFDELKRMESLEQIFELVR